MPIAPDPAERAGRGQRMRLQVMEHAHVGRARSIPKASRTPRALTAYAIVCAKFRRVTMRSVATTGPPPPFGAHCRTYCVIKNTHSL